VTEEGLLWEEGYVSFQEMSAVVFRQPSSFQHWELQIVTPLKTFSILGIPFKEAPDIKDMLEALNPELPIKTESELSVEENIQLANAFTMRTILLFISVILVFITSVLVLKSNLITNTSQRFSQASQTSQNKPGGEELLYLAAPLIGVLLFGAAYSRVRDLKEKTLDATRIPNGLTGQLSVNRMEELQAINIKVSQISEKAEDRYDPFTRTLCLTQATLEACSLTVLVLIAHEVAHLLQARKYGNGFLKIIKSFEALIKGSGKYVLIGLAIAVVALLLLGPEKPVAQFMLVFVVLVYLSEILIMGISLLIEMDADRRAFGLLKRARLVEKNYAGSIFSYLFFLTIMRVLLFVAFFLPTFGMQFVHFQENKTIRI
jgi:Zn-dependent membrane protease YugP